MKKIIFILTFLSSASALGSYPCSYKDSSGEIQNARVELFDEQNFVKVIFPGSEPSRYFVREGVDDGWFTYKQIGTIKSTERPNIKLEKDSIFKTAYGFEGHSKQHYQWQLGKVTFAMECISPSN